MPDSILTDFWNSGKAILLNQYSAVIILSSVLAVVGFLSNIPAYWWGEYILGVLLVLTLLGYHDKRTELRSLKESNQIILRRREASLLILEKEITVDVTEEQEDTGTYSLNLTSAFPQSSIEQFPALLKTDADVSWSELNFSIENAYPVHEERERTTNGDEKEFLLPCDFEQTISQPDHYEMSYCIQNDLIDPKGDWVSLVVREPTRIGRIQIELPQGWEVQTRRCYDIPMGEKEREESPSDDRYFDLRDNDRIIEWSRTDPKIGHEYRIEWTAEKVEN